MRRGAAYQWKRQARIPEMPRSVSSSPGWFSIISSKTEVAGSPSGTGCDPLGRVLPAIDAIAGVELDKRRGAHKQQLTGGGPFPVALLLRSQTAPE